ncbi:VanW family protein [Laceyella putida]|uniref:VanW family protein n=1 Tax=Laceyella putida TaxID=110101 RepID=A0ABW2RID6_9BACL
MESKKPMEEQLPEGKKDAAEELQSPANHESDEQMAAAPEPDAEMKPTAPVDEVTEEINSGHAEEVKGENDPQPAGAKEETKAEVTEEAKEESSHDRAFDTMELKIFGQWDTDGEAAPTIGQKKEADAAPDEALAAETEETVQNQPEEVVSAAEERQLVKEAPVSTPASVMVDFSEDIAEFEKRETRAAEEAQKAPTQAEPVPVEAGGVPDDTGVFKSVKREIRSTPRPKKLLVAAIASTMVIAGAVGFSAFAYEQQSTAVADTPKVQPVKKPNLFQLYLDDQKFELDLNTIGYDGKNQNTIDQGKLRAWLDTVQKQVNVEPKNAETTRLGAQITPEEPGRKVDVKKVETWLKNIKPLINKPQRIPTITLKPLVTTEDIKNVDKKLIGKYGTKFDPGNVNRTTNMKLASKAISGLILMPGEKFSFNAVVGPRTAKRGYKTAGVIVKGEFTEGIGGGICQVSSTLFNSVDEAGLKMVQVNHHSAEVTYVPKGRDATVSWGGPDFKFRNNLNKPVLIKIKMAGPYLTVYTYTAPGAKVNKKKVQAAPETFTQVKVNPTKPSEQLPKTGN